MRWNWRAIRALMVKDWKQVSQNKMVWIPMIVVPAIFLIVFPLVMTLLPSLMDPGQLQSDDFSALMKNMPIALKAHLQELSLSQQWVMISANYFFAPMFLIIPLMVSSILGADSFAGEKERKTLEGLLYTPLTDTELFVAKLLTALVPAWIINVASFILYGVVVNASGYRIMGRLFFPTATWWPLAFWLGPGISVAGLGATVLMSSKVKTFMEAQQASAFLVLPIVFLMIGQVSGLFFLSVTLLVLFGLLVWGIGLWLIWIGAKTFSRGELIVRT